MTTMLSRRPYSTLPYPDGTLAVTNSKTRRVRWLGKLTPGHARNTIRATFIGRTVKLAKGLKFRRASTPTSYLNKRQRASTEYDYTDSGRKEQQRLRRRPTSTGTGSAAERS